MKRLTFWVGLAVAGVLLFAGMVRGQAVEIPSKQIVARNYGSRDSITLTNITTKIGGTNKYVIIIDGGAWSISNNVTFGTNLALYLTPETYFDISAGSTVTVNGAWMADATRKFSGSGWATGSASFPWRHDEWGSTTQYNIGTGYISVTGDTDIVFLGNMTIRSNLTVLGNTTLSNLTVNGTCTNNGNTVLSNVTVRGTTDMHGQATASNLIVYSGFTASGLVDTDDIADGTIGSNDLAAAEIMDWLNTGTNLFGLPQLTLTTNMFSSDWEGATNFNFNTFTNIFDGNTNTFCNQAYLGTDEKGTLRLSLGGQYKGFVRSMPSINNIVSAQQTYLYATYHTYHYGYSQNYPLFGLWGPASWSTAAVGAWYQMWYVFPFEGSEIYFTHDCTTSGRGGVRYAVIEVYAVEVP